MLVTVAALGVATPAAHAETKRVGVVRFKGPGEGPARAKVINQLKAHNYQVVGQQQIGKTAMAKKLRLDTNDEFQALAKELGLSAIVSGELTKKKATITVRDGSDGSVSAEASWSGANPRKIAQAVDKTFWRRLGSAIDRGRAPAGAKKTAVDEEEAPADDAGSDEEEEKTPKRATREQPVAEDSPAAEEEERSKTAKKKKKKVKADPEEEAEAEEGGAMATGLEWLDIAFSPRALMRALRYNQDQFRELPDYNLSPIGPQVALLATVYPLAPTVGGFAGNVGLNVGYERVVGVTSKQGSTSFTTVAQTWWVGPRVRLYEGIYATLQYGNQKYRLQGSGAMPPDSGVPDADYYWIRAGGGARFQLTSTMALTLNAAYLHLIHIGELRSNDWFRRTTAIGAEVGAGLGVRLTPNIEIRGGVDLRRYGFAFNVPSNILETNPNAKVAGGAVDQYVMIYAALAIMLGGDEASGAERAEPAAESEEERPKPTKKKAAANEDEEDEPEL